MAEVGGTLSDDQEDEGLARVELDRNLAVSGLDPILGFHLRMANVALHRDFSHAMSEFGLTQKQAGVLILLYDNPGASQVDLAATLLTDRATMMGIIDRLQKRELVVRRRSVGDRRRQELYLSEEGRALRRRMAEVIDRHEKRFVDLFSTPELGMLIDFLRRVYSG